ncbi:MULTISPECIES: hypothetical protein [Stenotrophomonas]|uniref:hypothetical protein n=1 Tax=Stenotrophomonas indicatrix TaxID=2045451 RepID=UPI001DCDBC1E|nr:hypothetical protein [Stenotrophomonas lactitubi]CAH0184134.1 hypothetical protein SRABI35_01316 [Stenotrophomonas lactitubi]HED4875619.1 hypothetical protein [Stenotrophomonas maltophilia]
MKDAPLGASLPSRRLNGFWGQIAVMCYSAQIEAAYQKLVRMTGATVSLQEFAALYAHDPGKKRPKSTKGV